MKRKTVFTFLSVLALALFSFNYVFASQNETNLVMDNQLTNENQEIPFDSETEDSSNEIVPMINYSIINEPIAPSGNIWSQPDGFKYYRIHVVNYRNEPMKVTVSVPGTTSSWSFNVGASTSDTKVVSNAIKGLHVVDYSTSSGAVSGHISVRVSDTPF